jgi:hypothetical protein
MDPIIVIESNPVSYSGVCIVSSGSTVSFFVTSGLSSGIVVAYQWYLSRSGGTDTLVGIGTGYTLSSPEENDQIYLKIINCCGCSGGTGLIEDITFYFDDFTSGIPQVFYMDLMASFDYSIESIVLQCGPGVTTISDVEILVDGVVPVEWDGHVTSIDISSIITETIAIDTNYVLSGESVTISTSGVDSGPTFIRGKIRIRRQ